MTPENDALHLRAYSAILGVGPVEWLVALLRSDVPLCPSIRSRLADALDPEVVSEAKFNRKRSRAGRPQITMQNAAATRSRIISIIEAQEYLSNELKRGVSTESAVWDTVARFDVTRTEVYSWIAAEKRLRAEYTKGAPDNCDN